MKYKTIYTILAAGILLSVVGLLKVANAADQVNLNPFESVTVFCDAGENPECPTPEVDNHKFHGGSHAHAAKELRIDCTSCHGSDLMGGIAITDRKRPCAAPDGYIPHMGFPEQMETVDPFGIVINTTMTTVGILAANMPVACYSCHEEIKTYVNGEKTEFSFEDIRKQILMDLGFSEEDEEDENPTVPPTEPPMGEVFMCSEVHNPTSNCAECHADGRTCE